MTGSYSEQALTTLKDKGFRITKPRRLVVELLDSHQQALSAYEIKDLITAAGEKVDTVSVYRVLDCLEENHLIHRVLSTGKVKKCQLEHEQHCQKHQHTHCHHLLICQGCGLVQEIHCPETMHVLEQMSTSEALSNFKITGHNLEFLGLCAACA